MSTWSFISEMSGDTTSAVPPAHERGRLEAEGLAAAGRQHDDGVAAAEHGVHGFALERTEGGVAPVPGENVFEGDATLSLRA